MRRTFLSALAVSLCLACLPVLAQEMEPPLPPEGEAPVADGPEALSVQALSDACYPAAAMGQAEKDANARICDAYLSGMADGLFMMGAVEAQGTRMCLPDDGPISPDEAKAELKDYLTDHPEAMDHSAGVAVTFALIAAHPCE